MFILGQVVGRVDSDQLVPDHSRHRLRDDRNDRRQPIASSARHLRGAELQVQVRLRHSDRASLQTHRRYQSSVHAER